MVRGSSKKLQTAYPRNSAYFWFSSCQALNSRRGLGKAFVFLNFCIFKLPPVLLLCISLVGTYPNSAESQTGQRPPVGKKPKVIIGIAGTDQVEDIALGYAELADVQVYLESLGDMVDKYLIMLISNADNKRIRSKLSDEHGRVRFVGIAPGDYRVEVSRKLREDGELSTVRIGDLVLTRSQKRDFSSQLSDSDDAAPGSVGEGLNLNRK